MLIAGNGMVELYAEVAGNERITLSASELSDQKQKVANGLGAVTTLIIFIKILDKVYYRERLLPAGVFSWLDKFYKDTEANELRLGSAAQQATATAAAAAAAGNHRLSADSDFGEPAVGNRGGADGVGSGSKHSAASIQMEQLRTSSISSMQDGFVNRATFRVVPKSQVAMGIRRIRPLTALKLAVAVVLFFFWKVDRIRTQDYMTFFAALIVFPSLVEVVLEIRNFIIKLREETDQDVKHNSEDFHS